MTKTELLNEVHRRVRRHVRLNPLATRAIFEAITDVVAETINSGETVRIRGFGKFDIIMVPRKAVYDFKNKEMTTIPPRRKLMFKPSPKRFTVG